jgi:hypothetical protein
VPPLPVVPGVLRYQFQHKLGTDTDVLNSLYMYNNDPPVYTDETLLAAATGAATGWSSHIMALLSSSLTLTKVTVTDLGGSGLYSELGEATPGSVSGAYLGAASSLIVKFGIARRYRGGKPKVFLAGAPQAALTDNQDWDVTITAAMLAAWTLMLATVSAAMPVGGGDTTVLSQVNVSYYSGFTNHLELSGRYRAVPTLRAAPLIDPITTWSINPKVGSQRRRNEQRQA